MVSRHAWNTAAASSNSCAKRRKIFKPDSLASITSLAPVAWTVREVASRCSASRRNVILHEGISPLGVAIAPAYCTDAIFILTDGGLLADAPGGGASVAICCGTLKARSPSNCFVIYRGCPMFPCNCLTGSTSCKRRSRLAARSRKSRGHRRHSHQTCCTREGGVDQGSHDHVREWPTHTHFDLREPHLLCCQQDFNRPRLHRRHHLATSPRKFRDLLVPLKRPHDTRAYRGTTLRFGHK
jgi:hypothetical protein